MSNFIRSINVFFNAPVYITYGVQFFLFRNKILMRINEVGEVSNTPMAQGH